MAELLDHDLGDRNAAQKHAWRAAIILLIADGLGTAVKRGHQVPESYVRRFK